MSVPPSWATPQATVAAKTFQAATPLSTLPTSDAAPAAIPGLPGMPSAATGRAGVIPRYGLKMTVMSRPLSGG
nr:PE/PPE C-terminal domain-containing protein [Mycobacterium pseudokansasii]